MVFSMKNSCCPFHAWIHSGKLKGLSHAVQAENFSPSFIYSFIVYSILSFIISQIEKTQISPPMLTLECSFPFQCSSDAHCCSISYTAENDPHRTERNLPLDSSANSNGMAVAWISFHIRHVRKSRYLTVGITHFHQSVLPPWFSNNLCLSSLYGSV